MVVIIDSIRNIFGDTGAVSKMSFFASFPLIIYIMQQNNTQIDDFTWKLIYIAVVLTYMGFFIYILHATLNDENEYMAVLNPVQLIPKGFIGGILVLPVAFVSYFILMFLYPVINAILTPETAIYLVCVIALIPASLVFTILILYAKDFRIVDGLDYGMIMRYFHNLIFHVITQAIVLIVMDAVIWSIFERGLLPMLEDEMLITALRLFVISFLAIVNLAILANFVGELGWGVIYGDEDEI